MNLRKKTENSGEKGLTYYGDSLTLFGEMVEVSHRQTPRKDCDAKAPRQDSTISGFRLGIALPPGPPADGRDATAGGLHSLALAAVIPYAVGNGLALFFSVILLGLRVGGHHEQNTKG